MDVATDTCILINLAVVGRLDLLKTIPPFLFHAATEVLDEIQDLDQRAAVDEAIAAGHLDEIKLDQTGELSLYVNFNATLGKGESACLALAKARGWTIATDESKDPKWKRMIAGGSFAIINTPALAPELSPRMQLANCLQMSLRLPIQFGAIQPSLLQHRFSSHSPLKKFGGRTQQMTFIRSLILSTITPRANGSFKLPREPTAIPITLLGLARAAKGTY